MYQHSAPPAPETSCTSFAKLRCDSNRGGICTTSSMATVNCPMIGWILLFKGKPWSNALDEKHKTAEQTSAQRSTQGHFNTLINIMKTDRGTKHFLSEAPDFYWENVHNYSFTFTQQYNKKKQFRESSFTVGPPFICLFLNNIFFGIHILDCMYNTGSIRPSTPKTKYGCNRHVSIARLLNGQHF